MWATAHNNRTTLPSDDTDLEYTPGFEAGAVPLQQIVSPVTYSLWIVAWWWEISTNASFHARILACLQVRQRLGYYNAIRWPCCFVIFFLFDLILSLLKSSNKVNVNSEIFELDKSLFLLKGNSPFPLYWREMFFCLLFFFLREPLMAYYYTAKCNILEMFWFYLPLMAEFH